MKKEKLYKISVITIIIDQLIKLFIKTNITKDIVIIPKIFKITNVINTGAAFSILKNNNTLLILITIIILVLLNYYIKKNNIENDYFELGIILGGIVGNLFDRLLYNGVIDYIEISNFPVFNLADSLIVLGIILLIIKEFKKDFIKRL
jgi:lipoprotein signal peptidase